MLNKEDLIRLCDKIIEYSIYILIFCLPFSKTIVEVGASSSILFFFIKKVALHRWSIREYFPKTGLNNYICLFVLISLISSIFGSHPLFSVRSLFSKTLEYIGVFFALFEVFRSPLRIRRLLVVLTASFMLISADAAWQRLTGSDFIRGFDLYSETNMRLRGPFPGSGGFAAWLVTISPIVIAFILTLKRKAKYPAAIAVFLIFAIQLAATYSRSAWLAIALSFFLFIPVLYRALKNVKVSSRVIFITILAATILTCSSYILFFPQHEHRDIRHIFKLEDIAVQNRVNLWKQAYIIIKERPVLGWGVNTYSKIVPRYQIFDKGFYYPHNTLLHMAIEIGLAGTIIFILLLIRFFMKIIKSIWLESDIILLGTGIGLSSFFIHSLFDTTFYSLQTAILFWIIMALGLVRART